MLELPAQLVYHSLTLKYQDNNITGLAGTSPTGMAVWQNGPFHEGCWCSQTELCEWMVGELMPAVKVCISTWAVCFVLGFGEGTWGLVLTPVIRDQFFVLLVCFVLFCFSSGFFVFKFLVELCVWVKLKRMNKDRYKLAFPRLSYWFVLQNTMLECWPPVDCQLTFEWTKTTIIIKWIIAVS